MTISKPVFVFVFLSVVLTLCSCGPFGVIPLLGAAAGGGGGGGGGDPTGPLPPPNPTLSLYDLTDTSLVGYSNDTTVGVNVTGISADVTHYMLDEVTTTQPDPLAAGWQAVPIITTYDFGTAGTKTLYLWVKNSADLVNTGVVLAPVEIDMTLPVDPSLTLKDTDTDDPLLTDDQTVNVEVSNIDADVVAYIISETHTTAPTELSSDWISSLPATFDLSAGEALKTVYLWVKDHAGNICANPGIHQIIYNTAVIADPIYHLEDLTSGSSAYSNATTVAVVPTSIDVDATYYLISETQSSQPLPTDPNWQAMPLPDPMTFDLSGTGLRTVYIWLKDDLGAMNPNPAPSQIEVDMTAPGTPTLTLLDQSSGDTAHTNDLQVGVTTSGIDADVTHFILSEGIAATPAENDSSWTALPVGGVFTCTSGDGDKTGYLWLKDQAGNVCDNPGVHTIELDTTINSPTLALQDQDSGSQSWCNDQTVDTVIGSVDSDIVEYIISETIVATPGISAPEWNSIQPVAYTFDTATEEQKTVYLWVKDDAENIAGTSAQITYDATDPTASANPGGGLYTGLTSVTLGANDNMDPSPAVYYTTDGSDPNTASTLYTVPIDMTVDTILKFIAVDAAGNQSGIYQENYVVTLLTTYVATTGNDLTGNGTAANPYASIWKGLDSAKSGTTVLVLDGTYKGTTNRDLDFAGKDIYLKSSGGAANCIIDCELSGRGFYFHLGETSSAIVDGFTIQNGDIPGGNGGGILCDGASPTIANCIITNNSADSSGGGIFCQNGSNPTITGCTIANNTAVASQGGGIFCWNSSPTITTCTVTGNSAGNWGGGIYCFDNASPTVIANCLIANNSASRGGGICLDLDSSSVITNCTTASNSADYGGGIYLFNASATVNNSVIWGNTAATEANQIHVDGTSTAALNYSCFANGLGDVVGTVTTNNCINSNPLFRDAPNGDYRLKCGSLCFDKGDGSVVTWTEDLDGNPRIMGRCVDIGAYELTVIRVPADKPTIQEGIDAASDWDVVLLANGRYIGVGNRNIDFRGYRIAVRSEFGPENCVVDCQGSPANNARGFSFLSGETADSVLEGVTIVNGYVEEAGPLPGGGGGGIFCNSSHPTIRRCVIEDCEVYGTNATFGHGCGAGICGLGDSHPTILNCQIRWNWAESRGGGIFFFCEHPAGDAIKILNCLISDNEGEEDGGGIFIWGNMAGDPCYCNITNCTITGNYTEASGLAGGGGIFACAFASIRMANTIVWNNFSAVAGNEEIMVYSTALAFDISYSDVVPARVEDTGTIITWGGGNILLDPLFTNPSSSYYHLLTGSPCIEAGDNSVVTWSHDLDILYSDRRKRIWGANVDMGCYEGGWLPVPAAYTTIQSAINAATDGDMVPVAPGKYTGAGNKDLTFAGKKVTLYGAYEEGDCIIDCEGSGRGLNFSGGEGPDTVVIGFIIENGNTSTGGAIQCDGSSPTIINCAMIGNESTSFGGAVYCSDAGPTLINCLMDGNDTGTGGIGGGALYNFNDSRPKLINCTLINNTSESPGGAIRSHASAQSLNVVNCVIWGNFSASGTDEIASEASTVRVRYSDVDSTGCVGVVWETGNLFTDPEFAQNGWGHLKKTSPCIDAGDSSAVAWSRDLDGRPRLLGAGVDMGCYEGAMLIVPLDWTFIQDAIDAASDYDIVLVEDGVYGANRDKNLDPGGKNLWIMSRNGPGACIIDCGGAGRGFVLNSGEDDNCVIDGFTITNGNITGTGGGILVSSSNPSIYNCVITNNASSSHGGGIYCSNSSPEISHCTIRDNSSGGSGGGIRASTNSHPTIINCLIANNFSIGVGAGVAFDTGCDAMMTNCTIANNESAGNAGGLYIYQNVVTLDNCILWGNMCGGFAHSIMKAGSLTDTYLYMNNCCYAVGANQISGGGSMITISCITEDPTINPNYPMFVDLGAPGVGGGGIFSLLPASPCIDMGENSFVFWGEDLDGAPRIVDGGSGSATVDMGAYEYQP